MHPKVSSFHYHSLENLLVENVQKSKINFRLLSFRSQRKYLFYCSTHVGTFNSFYCEMCYVKAFILKREVSYLTFVSRVHSNRPNIQCLCSNYTQYFNCLHEKCFNPVANITFIFLLSTVPRKVLIDRFESTPEPDEPLQIDDLEPEQDELYDEDQFYKESDISPGPAPKLQGDIAKKPQRFDGTVFPVTSSVGPPLRTRDDSSLEGEGNCLSN